MRVIAGTAKGRKLVAPKGGAVRPTADRVKEALFSIVAPILPDAQVLDLYAGAGGLGIEALSRGAAHTIFVDKNTKAVAALRTNLEHSGFVARARVLQRSVSAALSDPSLTPASLVVADPPYDTDHEALNEVLVLLAECVMDGGLVSLERPFKAPAPRWPDPFMPHEPRRYGDTALHLAQRSRR